MTARQFFDLVAAMRWRQREYYATRSRDALAAARTLEKRVDDEVARVMALLKAREAQGGAPTEPQPPPAPLPDDYQDRYAKVEAIVNEFNRKRKIEKL